MSALGPRPASFTSQTSSILEAEETGVMHVSLIKSRTCSWCLGSTCSGAVVPTCCLVHYIKLNMAGPVEAEVFENERFLPFRGWGHQWPGHLLPTDRVGHWSLRGDVPSGAESMDFHNVAPKLRQVPACIQSTHCPCIHTKWGFEKGIQGSTLSYYSLQTLPYFVSASRVGNGWRKIGTST